MPRLRRLPKRLKGPAGAILALAVAGFGASGAYVYLNTNVWNPYRTHLDTERYQADYEKALWKFHDTPQPKITAVKLDVHEVPCGYPRCDLNDLDIDVSWFGTGVRRIPGHRPHAQAKVPQLILSMVPLGRKRREIVDGEDDSERLEEQAREQEREAAGEDE